MNAKRKKTLETKRARRQNVLTVNERASESANARLKRLRLALGYAREAFAEALGVGERKLFALESGKRPVSARDVELVARTFGVDRVWLATGLGRPYPNVLDATRNLLLVPNAPFIMDEERLDEELAASLSRFQRAVAALDAEQRVRALQFYVQVVAALSSKFRSAR